MIFLTCLNSPSQIILHNLLDVLFVLLCQCQGPTPLFLMYYLCYCVNVKDRHLYFAFIN